MGEPSGVYDMINAVAYYIYGNAGMPAMHHVRLYGSKGQVLVIDCPCNNKDAQFRLGNGRAVRCPSCGTLWARVEDRVTGTLVIKP